MIKLIKSILYSVLSVFILTFFVGIFTKIAHSPAGLNGAFLIASVSSIIAILGLFFWGLPIHLVLKRYGKTNIIWYILAGILPCFVAVFVFYPFGKDEFQTLIMQATMLSIVGALVSSVFWFFATKNA